MRAILDDLGGWHVEQGDNLLVLPTLPAESCDSIVTDPPYGLSFRGKDWDHGVPGPHFWVAALRVAKPGAYLLAFGGTRTHHRLACAIEDAGWEIRDCIMWLYGSGFPKSLDVSKAIDKAAGAERAKEKCGGLGSATSFADDTWTQENQGYRIVDTPILAAAAAWQGWGTALKPAWEPIIMARKPLIETVAANVQKYGTGAINIDGCRVTISEDDPVRTAVFHRNGKRTAYGDFAADDTGELSPMLRSNLGRWPANLIHDGSEDVVVGFPDSKGAMGDVKGNEPSTPGYSGGFGRSPASSKRGDSGSASRFFYCAKASKADRNEGLEGEGAKRDESRNAEQPSMNGGKGNPYNRGCIPVQNTHPTVKPTALMRYLCKLVTPPGGVVLDPFAGSGSTGKAARLEGFRFLGIELEESYCTIARARIGAAKA
jgi:DNA modification methylase